MPIGDFGMHAPEVIMNTCMRLSETRLLLASATPTSHRITEDNGTWRSVRYVRAGRDRTCRPRGIAELQHL